MPAFLKFPRLNSLSRCMSRIVQSGVFVQLIDTAKISTGIVLFKNFMVRSAPRKVNKAADFITNISKAD